jgi:hypothetical protein
MKASTQCRNSEPNTSKWRRVANHVRLCREAFAEAFRLGRRQQFEDELVRNGLSLVEKRVATTLDILRRGGRVLHLDAHRKACRHITHSMTTDLGLHEELAELECLPIDRHSARLHLAALDRGIGRELRALVSALADDTCAPKSVGRPTCSTTPGSSIRSGRVRCRQTQMR